MNGVIFHFLQSCIFYRYCDDDRHKKNKQTPLLASSCTHDELVIEVECTTVSLKLTDSLRECNRAVRCAVMLCLFVHLMGVNCIIRRQILSCLPCKFSYSHLYYHFFRASMLSLPLFLWGSCFCKCPLHRPRHTPHPCLQAQRDTLVSKGRSCQDCLQCAATFPPHWGSHIRRPLLLTMSINGNFFRKWYIYVAN